MWSRDIGLLTTPANISRIWQLSPKGGRAGGSPDGWLGGWLVGWLVTNFPDRVCDNKVSRKKPAHSDQKWPRNGCLKFSRHFGGGWGPPPPQKWRENLKQPYLGHFWSKWAGFLHEALLSHTLSRKLVTAPPPTYPPTHLSGLPPARPPLGKSCQIRLIFAGMVIRPKGRLHMKF